MPLIRVESNKSLALTRVNILLERVFSVAATLIGLQTFSNAIVEFNAFPLNPFWFWLNFGLLASAHLLIIFLVWFRGDGRVGFAGLTIATVFAIVTWSFQLDGGSLGPGEQPWIWWSVGIAGIASVGGFGVFFSAFFLVILPTMWFFLQISDIGLPADPWVALQDASFAFLFSTVLAGFVWVLRYEASRVDAANDQANLAAIELARIDAISRERDRVDALVHDSVLTTLLLAANAEDAEAEKAAEESAANALTKLRNTDALASNDESITINSLFSALEIAIHRLSPSIPIESEGSTNYAVPVGVASAITEATLQALANAINHAGQAVTIQVFLKGSANGLKIVVKDNGRGFRPSRVPKNRIGLRLSIIGRMQAVGGKVFIDSKIGVGTNVIIEWSAP